MHQETWHTGMSKQLVSETVNSIREKMIVRLVMKMFIFLMAPMHLNVSNIIPHHFMFNQTRLIPNSNSIDRNGTQSNLHVTLLSV